MGLFKSFEAQAVGKPQIEQHDVDAALPESPEAVGQVTEVLDGAIAVLDLL